MSDSFLPINGTDFVEFYVGNAKQAAYYYQTAFGFQPLAYRGLETGDREKTSYVVRDGKATIVSDTQVNAITSAVLTGVEFYRLWGADKAPTFPDDGLSAPQIL